jgi:high-affinity iron transporter
VIATFVIFLREGIEASMIVAILLAYLDRIGERRQFVYVLGGVGAALGLAIVGGIIAFETIRSYDGSRVQTIFETITYLLAAVVLTYMTFWMRRHARSISSELRARTDVAITAGARRGLFLLAFQSVGREGLETVVFTLAIIFSTSARGASAGAAAGLAISLSVAFLIYRLGMRINLGRFFTVVGMLLMVFAAGLLVNAIENLQQLGWLPYLTHPIWNTTEHLSQDSSVGDLIHSFFGYVSQPTPLEVGVWVLYVAITASAFLGLWQRPFRGARDVSSS